MEFTKRFGVGESQVTHQTLAMHIDSMNKFHQLHRALTYTMGAFTQVYTEEKTISENKSASEMRTELKLQLVN